MHEGNPSPAVDAVQREAPDERHAVHGTDHGADGHVADARADLGGRVLCSVCHGCTGCRMPKTGTALHADAPAPTTQCKSLLPPAGLKFRRRTQVMLAVVASRRRSSGEEGAHISRHNKMLAHRARGLLDCEAEDGQHRCQHMLREVCWWFRLRSAYPVTQVQQVEQLPLRVLRERHAGLGVLQHLRKAAPGSGSGCRPESSSGRHAQSSWARFTRQSLASEQPKPYQLSTTHLIGTDDRQMVCWRSRLPLSGLPTHHGEVLKQVVAFREQLAAEPQLQPLSGLRLTLRDPAACSQDMLGVKVGTMIGCSALQSSALASALLSSCYGLQRLLG